MTARNLWLLFCVLPGCTLSGAAAPAYLERPEVQRWIERIVAEHQLPEPHVRKVVAAGRHRPEILASARRPAESMAWHRYRTLLVTPARIRRGRDYLQQHAALFDAAQRTYGVPAALIAAVIGIESDYGRNIGKHLAIDALLTLGFDYPRRAEFFRGQLEHLFLLEREAGLDIPTLRSSWAGALGMGQFIPSSYRAFAVDADQDGRRDLWDSPADIIASIAHYFHQHDWRPDRPVAEAVAPPHPDPPPLSAGLKPDIAPAQLQAAGIPLRHPEAQAVAVHAFEVPDGREYWIGYHNFYVITRYNHSALYALAVYQLSEALHHDPDS